MKIESLDILKAQQLKLNQTKARVSMTNQKAECFKCGTAIWVPNYEYVSDRNFCYPCASSYMGHTTGVSLEELDKVRTDMRIDNA
jgi:formylmethanofuran dehydrogenase subunit E